MDHLPKSWSIDQDSRDPGFALGYARQARVRVKITEKQIHIEKSLTLGNVFLYRHTLKILRSKGRENVSVYAICIKPFAFT